MFLKRIQIENFKVLKDVDISFEENFTPRVFPLGSLNGGGKSTLLQLIFTLLHCSFDENKKEFVKNILEGFEIENEKDITKPLAKIDIIHEGKEISFDFFVAKDEILGDKDLSFNAIKHLNIMQDELENMNDLTLNLFDVIHNISTKKLTSSDIFYMLDKFPENKDFLLKNPRKTDLLLENLKKEEKILTQTYKNLEKKEKLFIKKCHQLDVFLENKKYFYIQTYNSKKTNEHLTLLCQLSNRGEENLFQKISEKIYLAAPSTQIHLLLPLKTRKLLFQNNSDYYAELEKAKTKLPNFFTYNFFSLGLLIDLLKKARNKDFDLLNTKGNYGTNYKKLLDELNTILKNKRIVPNSDLTNIIFKQKDTDLELNPEDLSHGELKRLSLFMWIKFKQEDGSFVLIDEIENTLHPDWQFQIIKDMVEWSPKNQYILATHSYEVCEAVTPAHVKELNPKLLK